MNKKIQEQIKKSLLERKEKIEQELAEFAHKDPEHEDNYISDVPDYGNKDDENAEEIAAYGDRISIEHSLETTLRDINKTLERIEKGEYGNCKYCGKAIPEKRLMARPVSSSCMDCKERLSNK